MFEMLAILGRGIQRLHENGPWVLTEDLEVCDERSAHLPVRVKADDENPCCMIGGGDMNQKAGKLFAREYNPSVIVCAYGDRSGYLKSVDGPTESEVMGQALRDHLTHDFHNLRLGRYPEVVIWPRTRSMDIPSNTRQELLNVFDLALGREIKRIAIVTVGVHVPRTATYVAKHLSVFAKYRSLSPVVFESEEVLLGFNRAMYTTRVEALRNSKSFARNWAREADGIQKTVRDVYGDAKPLVTATA